MLRSRVLYFGIMHVVAKASSVRACQMLRRKHAANIWSSLIWPWMLGWVETARIALETSLRGHIKGSVCVGSDLSDRNTYDEARNWITATNGETDQSTEVICSPLLVYINLLALLYVLHAWTIGCVETVWLYIEYLIEQVEVLLCPTHAEPLNHMYNHSFCIFGLKLFSPRL